MTYELGSILLVYDYQLPTKTKDKFFIVIGYCENEVSLLSMTTSQVYFDSALIRHGLIEDRDLSVYCFEKNRVIGQNGFAFHKHTFVSHRNNIHIFSEKRMNTLNVEYKDCLTKTELMDLIYSIYKKSPFKYKDIFEKILTEIS